MQLERETEALAGLSDSELSQKQGLGKSIAAAIYSLAQHGSFPQLDDLLAATPAGVQEMLTVKGLGPKKVRQIWQELQVESTEELLAAAEDGRLAKTKGFGKKTAETVREALLFKQANAGKLLYAEAELLVGKLEYELNTLFPKVNVSPVGAYRRKMEIIDSLDFLLATDLDDKQLKKISWLKAEDVQSSPYCWRATEAETGLSIQLYFCTPEHYANQLFRLTATEGHLQKAKEADIKLWQAAAEAAESEEEIYQRVALPYIVPELREGGREIEWAQEKALPKLLQYEELKGILHNHSTYSDGKHNLKEMAEHCRDLGFAYFGISDHSRTASYAGGLEIERVLAQHQEIDELNKVLAPFRIFKGIESDILTDGSLDYPDDILARFDFVVASIHSSLNMSQAKATDRLITAINNPYTTILGHATGRLLLRRAGYPIDHREVIKACAEKGVIIEINANPWRLDIDWRWVDFALQEGVLLSINPDAHEKDGLLDMKYGVYTGRKGGLTARHTFNAYTLEEVTQHFEARRKQFPQP